jgi:hypothetical protein
MTHNSNHYSNHNSNHYSNHYSNNYKLFISKNVEIITLGNTYT